MIMAKFKLTSCFFSVFIVLHTSVDAHYDEDLRVVNSHSEHPGKCYDDVTKAAYYVGETWEQGGECVQHKCIQHKGKFVISTSRCTDTSKFENDIYCWIMEGDIASSYPSCCPIVLCA